MSMVISNGFKFNGTILELQEELLKLRKLVTQFLNEDFTEEVQRYILRLVEDSTSLSEEEFLKKIENIFPKDMDEERRRKTPIFSLANMYLREYMDFFLREQTAMVYPYEENVFYLCGFGIKYLTTQMNENPKFEEFSYWDNVDHPEEIKEEDWDARKVIWDAIFERADTLIFGHAGFSFDMYPDKMGIFNIMDQKMPVELENNIRISPKFRKDEDFDIRKVYILRLQELIDK